MKPLALTPIEPEGSQASLFGAPTPIYPAYNRSRGDKLRTIRQDLKLTEGQGAHRLGIQAKELTAIERGELKCDYDDAEARMRRHRA